MKKCNKCNKEKQIIDFYTQRKSRPTSRCKECIKQLRKEYVKKNIKKCRDASRDYYYRIVKNKTDFSKLYRERSFKNGVDGYLATITKSCLKRKGGDIDWRFIKEIWNKQKGICALTGYEMTFILGNGKIYTNASIDRINPKGIYTKDNVRLVCAGANIARGIMDDEQFIKMCDNIINYAAKKR